MANYNYALAFTEFCSGISLEDISAILNIPLKTLRTHARQNGWRKLADTLASRLAQGSTAPKAEQEMARIKENRERNFKIAAKLRDDLERVIDALLDGTLRVPKVLSSGKVIEVEPSIKDMLDIANCLKNIMEITARCLGDTLPAREPEAKHEPVPAVQINLPAAIMLPRHLRSLPTPTETLTLPAQETEKN